MRDVGPVGVAIRSQDLVPQLYALGNRHFGGRRSPPASRTQHAQQTPQQTQEFTPHCLLSSLRTSSYGHNTQKVFAANTKPQTQREPPRELEASSCCCIKGTPLGSCLLYCSRFADCTTGVRGDNTCAGSIKPINYSIEIFGYTTRAYIKG